MSESAAAGIAPGPEAGVYSFEHHAAFSTWKNRGMTCKDMPDHLLEALCEDKNFRDEVRTERERRALALIPLSLTRPPTSATPGGWTPHLPSAKNMRLDKPGGFEFWAQENQAACVTIGMWAAIIAKNKETFQRLEGNLFEVPKIKCTQELFGERLEALESQIRALQKKLDEALA